MTQSSDLENIMPLILGKFAHYNPRAKHQLIHEVREVAVARHKQYSSVDRFAELTSLDPEVIGYIEDGLFERVTVEELVVYLKPFGVALTIESDK